MSVSKENLAEKPVFALMYDFDKTLSPKDMQEYAFIPELGMEPAEFWGKCDELLRANNMDQILAYMYVMCREARGKKLLTKETLRALGAEVVLFPGVATWFSRVNAYAEELGIALEHYIISSGVKEIIEGTTIAHEFKEIYAAEFLYNAYGEPIWPAMAVNYTSKTQFLFRINKGVLSVTDNKELNEYMPEEKRRVPFRNMIYIGDGLTDVPCMKLVRENGGHSIAVYSEDKSVADTLILNRRAHYSIHADYTEKSEMEQTVFAILSLAAAQNKTMKMRIDSFESAQQSEGCEEK